MKQTNLYHIRVNYYSIFRSRDFYCTKSNFYYDFKRIFIMMSVDGTKLINFERKKFLSSHNEPRPFLAQFLPSFIRFKYSNCTHCIRYKHWSFHSKLGTDFRICSGNISREVNWRCEAKLHNEFMNSIYESQKMGKWRAPSTLTFSYGQLNVTPALIKRYRIREFAFIDLILINVHRFFDRSKQQDFQRDNHAK